LPYCSFYISSIRDPRATYGGKLNFYPSTRLAALDSADRFFLLHTAQFALADEPAFAAHRAEDAALDNLFAEALEQAILRLIRA
jgi:hypothetical protein